MCPPTPAPVTGGSSERINLHEVVLRMSTLPGAASGIAACGEVVAEHALEEVRWQHLAVAGDGVAVLQPDY